MSTLYIAATAFQLITILNIRVNMGAPKGDLILHEKSIPNSHYIKDRIIETGLFDKVYLFKDYDSRLNTIFTGKNTLLDYLRLVYKKHLSKMDINEYLEGDGLVKLEQYNEVFCFNKKFLDIVSKYNNIKINFIDEGVGSYTDGTIRTCKRIDSIYLYKPELAVYYEKYKEKFSKVPALDTRNHEFRDLLNKIWGYNDIIQFGDNAVIIFDQPWRIAPQYFSKIPTFFKDKLLAKSKIYSKYANDEKAKDFFVHIISNLQLANDNVIVKMHPRSSIAMKQYYISKGLRVLENTSIPWEIVFLNLKIDKILLVSMFSTVTLSLGIYFKESITVSYESIFLYKVAARLGNVHIPNEIVVFLENIATKLPKVRVLDNSSDIENLNRNNF